MPELIPLIGLPEGCEICWCHIYVNSEDHIHDQDMVWIEMSNGIGIDAGQYGSFFKVVVVSRGGDWRVFESSYCQTTQEVASEIIRLANKYYIQWYSDLANKLTEQERASEKEFGLLYTEEVQVDEVNEKISRKNSIKSRVEQCHLRLDQLYERYEWQRKEVQGKLNQIRQECPHSEIKWYPDASGNNDSSECCLICGLEAKKIQPKE